MGTLSVHPSGAALASEYDGAMLPVIRRSIPGIVFSKPERVWIVPHDSVPAAIEFAESFGWDVSEALYCQRELVVDSSGLDLERAHARAEAAGIELYPYQPAGISFLVSRRSAILAWDMRTGKTVISLCSVPEGAPLVVVAPTSALYQWEGEIRRLLPRYKVEVRRGRAGWQWPCIDEAVVVAWGSLPAKAELIKPKHGTVLLGDECHYAKNPRAERTSRFRALHREVYRNGGRSWGLSGTPIQNNPMELWNLLSTYGLNQVVFGSWDAFLAYYSADREWGRLKFQRPSPEVPDLLRRAMHRVTFAQAAPHIPHIRPQFMPVEVAGAGVRSRLWGPHYPEWEAALLAGRPAPESFSTARKELAALKAEVIPAVLEDLSQAGGGPFLVFSEHRAPIEALGKRERWGTIVGGMSPRQREDVRRRFQAGLLDGVAATIGAGGVALTLSRARTLLFVDLHYNPTLNAQAMARASAVDKAEAPGVYILTARGTVDERVLQILEHKTQMARATLGDRPPPPRPGDTRAGALRKVAR